MTKLSPVNLTHKEALEEVLLGAIKSGDAIKITAEMVDEVRARLRSRAAKRVPSANEVQGKIVHVLHGSRDLERLLDGKPKKKKPQ